MNSCNTSVTNLKLKFELWNVIFLKYCFFNVAQFMMWPSVENIGNPKIENQFQLCFLIVKSIFLKYLIRVKLILKQF